MIPEESADPQKIYQWLLKDPKELWSLIHIEYFKGKGPGGQKKNKSETAVKLTFSPLNVTQVSQNYRSREENKISGLRRLREKIALQSSDLPPPEVWERGKIYFKNGLHVNPKNNDFALVLAILSGYLHVYPREYKKIAQELGITHSRLNRFINENKLLSTKKDSKSNEDSRQKTARNEPGAAREGNDNS